MEIVESSASHMILASSPAFIRTIALPIFIIFKWSDMRTAIARAQVDLELQRDKNLPVP